MTRDETIRHYYRLIPSTLKALCVSPSSWEDAWGIAALELVQAVDRYKPDRGATLQTYLIGCMRMEVLNSFKARGSKNATETDAAWAMHSKRFGDVDATIDANRILERLDDRDRYFLTHCDACEEPQGELVPDFGTRSWVSRQVCRARQRARRLA